MSVANTCWLLSKQSDASACDAPEALTAIPRDLFFLAAFFLRQKSQFCCWEYSRDSIFWMEKPILRRRLFVRWRLWLALTWANVNIESPKLPCRERMRKIPEPRIVCWSPKIVDWGRPTPSVIIPLCSELSGFFSSALPPLKSGWNWSLTVSKPLTGLTPVCWHDIKVYMYSSSICGCVLGSHV